MGFFYYILCVGICVTFANGELLGKFVFHGNEIHNDQSYLSVLHKPDSVLFAPSAGPIQSEEISSILSLSLGLSVYKDIKWPGLQVGSLFSRPKAVMMINVDGLPKDDKLKLSATETFPVTMTDTASSVGDTMLVSSKASLPSHVNSIFDGKSTTISISADEKTSTSGFSNGDSSKTAFWDEMSDSWKIVTGDGDRKDSLSKHQIIKRIPQILKTGFTYDEHLKNVGVNTKSLQFTFNLEDQAVFNFFSELVYIHWQCDELAMNKQATKDNVPDVYLFTISSLKGLEKKYGGSSKQLQAALLMLEKFVPEVVERFVKLYGGDILITGLIVKSDIGYFEEHKEEMQNIFKSISNEYVQDFDSLIPELHVSSKLEHQARQKLCQSIQGSISARLSSLKFKCATEQEVHKVARRSLLAAAAEDDFDPNLSSVYDEIFPVIFNMWFWLMVLLFLAVYAISLSMWYMDPGDSIIYRLTQQRIKSE